MSDTETAESTATRLTGVSARILSLLQGRAKTTAELISEGGFSNAGAFLNLKKLKDQGLVEAERVGRLVIYRLTEATAGVAITPNPALGRSKGRKPKAADAISGNKVTRKKRSPPTRVVVSSLRDELSAIAARFAPVYDLDRKLDVLDKLAKTMPREVASVLNSIKKDLIR